MTNLDPKHLDALVAEFRAGRICAENGAQCRAMDEPSGCRCAMAADAITALRAQIDRERAATIEAAAQWHMDRIAEANRQIAENNEYLAKHGLTDSEANERCREKVWNSRVAIRAIRALHTDATRAAMDAIRREGYEAGVREAAKLYEDGGGPGVGGWDYFGDFYDALIALAASIPPDPDTNADSGQPFAVKATEAECPQPEKWRAGECCGGCLGSSKRPPLSAKVPRLNDDSRSGYRAGIMAAARWLETVPQSLPHRQEYAEQVRALAEKGEQE